MSASDEARKVAERAMPGWVVVDDPEPIAKARKVDSVGLDIETLKRKWFGQEASAQATQPEVRGEAETVVMRMRGKDADIIGNKTAIVRDGKIIGMQG